jgi:pyrroline-5-carboxylate reductase
MPNDASLLGLRLGIIGIGNMGEALLAAALRQGLLAPDRVIVSDPSEERLAHIQARLGVRISAHNLQLVSQCHMVLLAVKPQQIKQVLEEIQHALTPQHVLMSVAAGVTTAYIESLLPAKCPVIRAMPNTPALVGAGASAYCRGRYATEEHAALAQQFLHAAGFAVQVNESLIDPITAVSGSGPAYIFRLMEYMVQGAVQLGLDEGLAQQLVLHTVAGAGRLALESGEPPSVLRAKVTSKGGTTAAALAELEARGLGSTMSEAMKAAHRRAQELSAS